MESLPKHLCRYIVEQDDSKYTPVDQAVWRYILRQLRHFLKTRAHECYLEGLEKTGIEIERIPRISDISAKLEKFGWRALPVSGFIPPAAFMELQALSVLPIASDLRSLDHLLYTPAPDIVHEAAGHAPILIHPEFAEYLKAYAQVARKAILSKEDLDLYEAIRVLSDLKEHPDSTTEEIQKAQENLDQISKSMSHVSEAAQLSRMNWWTAEYGLIGDLKNPKIFGAGLLSSVGESRWCLSDKVKKIPLTVDCINQSYDITEPQPQLFVTPDFATLKSVLEEMADQMAFRTGGLSALKKAVQSKTINTVQLNSGLQISGDLKAYRLNQDQIAYLNFQGPTQLAFRDKEIPGHSKEYHSHGFGTALGPIKGGVFLSQVKHDQLAKLGLTKGKSVQLETQCGVIIEGTFEKALFEQDQLLILTFTNCRVSHQGEILFDPAWGTYDLGVGESVTSVFGGPADRIAFGETDDFVAARVPSRKWSDSEKQRHRQYQILRDFREGKLKDPQAFAQALEFHQNNHSLDWLFWVEALELAQNQPELKQHQDSVRQYLEQIQNLRPSLREMIQDGMELATQL